MIVPERFTHYFQQTKATFYHCNNRAPLLLGKAKVLGENYFSSLAEAPQTASAFEWLNIIWACLSAACQLEQKCFCENSQCPPAADCTKLRTFSESVLIIQELKDKVLKATFGISDVNTIRVHLKLEEYFRKVPSN